MDDCKIVEVRRPCGGQVEPMTATGVGKGDNVACCVIIETIASNVAIGNEEAGRNLMRMYLLSCLSRNGVRKVRDAVNGLPV